MEEILIRDTESRSPPHYAVPVDDSQDVESESAVEDTGDFEDIRPDIVRTRGIVENAEIMNDHRTDEVITALERILPAERDEWLAYMEDPENVDERSRRDNIEIDWDYVREHACVSEKMVDSLEDRITRSPDTLMRLQIRTPGIAFAGGDYVTIGLLSEANGKELQYPADAAYADDDGVYTRTVKRAYSTANSPLESIKDMEWYSDLKDERDGVKVLAEEQKENIIELCIRRISDEEADENSLTPILFEPGNVETGDEIIVNGAFNDELALDDIQQQTVVAMATGTGIAPIRSILHEYIDRGKEDKEWYLFLTSSYIDETPYREELNTLGEEYDWFHPTIGATREEFLDPEYDGPSAYIQHELLRHIPAYYPVDAAKLSKKDREYLMDSPDHDDTGRILPSEADFLVCGLTRMTGAVAEYLDAFDVPDGQRQIEPFG